MGGGGDGGAEKRQAEMEAKKQAARDVLNAQFGIAGSEPKKEDFYKTQTVYDSRAVDKTDKGAAPRTPREVRVFDQEAYDKAVQNRNLALTNSSARENIYTGLRDDAFSNGLRQLDEAKNQAARKNKFELFARGLAGGSEDINQNALLGRTYSQGLLDLGAKADLVKSDAKSSDEMARLNLLQSIDSGMDAGSVSSSAISQLNNSAERAAAQAFGTGLGDIFATTGLLYNQGQAAKGKADGTAWWNNYNQSRTPRSGATGSISSVN